PAAHLAGRLPAAGRTKGDRFRLAVAVRDRRRPHPQHRARRRFPRGQRRRADRHAARDAGGAPRVRKDGSDCAGSGFRALLRDGDVMSELWIEIEQLVLDGAAFDPAKARRVAALTEMALERLLRERGSSAAMLRSASRTTDRPDLRAEMRT